ncbi:30S ribosomal protein S8 [Candidatus Gottesmanbacteria bacterium RBG_16_52_11]|uniref:Small ribosomal subunit protein uS8 n=1 Tax=Candidatus Gottesmanbacteria bacterium RBG_16_52_11 TaxID=1798374 RepID=A0A1F5YY50_9BACT|nr:MAG: 30S ribosomal protein S8 [Candidatus Gottesmanbacteria bacterium RBG_16_52_11]
MVNDPIGDMLAQIKNATLAGKSRVVLPHSKLRQRVAEVIRQEGFLESVEKTGTDPKSQLVITLRYNGKEPVITDIKRKSKPGLRVYVNKRSIPRVLSGLGVAIVSTPKGIMTGREAKKLGVGGELVCELW